MHHTAPWYLPWGLKLVPLPIPPGHPASGIPNPGLHLLAPLPGIYAPEPRKVGGILFRSLVCSPFRIDPSNFRRRSFRASVKFQRTLRRVVFLDEPPIDSYEHCSKYARVRSHSAPAFS